MVQSGKNWRSDDRFRTSGELALAAHRRGVAQDGHLGSDLLSLEATLRRLDAIRSENLRQLEVENTPLRRVVADLTLDKEMLQEVVRRKPRRLLGDAR
jgi:hypothetical protein